jgi:hypothetical protein
MIVIGADTHKGTHALAAVDEGTGRVRGSRQIQAEEAGHLAAVRWARELDDERVWAIEDCRHVSGRLASIHRVTTSRVADSCSWGLMVRSGRFAWPALRGLGRGTAFGAVLDRG